MRAAVVLAVAAAVVVAPALPVSAEDRMALDCEGIDLVVERTNGTSWWGSDGAVYTTKHLRIEDEYGGYEKSYGHVSGDVVVCEADHDVDGYWSRWTVDLVLAH
jgi:hypothetical protein